MAARSAAAQKTDTSGDDAGKTDTTAKGQDAANDAGNGNDAANDTASTETASSAAAMFELTTFDKIPPRNATQRGKYPFEAMQPGQRFFVPDEKQGKGDAARKVSTAASSAAKRLGKTFVVRSESHDGKTGAFVYCTNPDEDSED